MQAAYLQYYKKEQGTYLRLGSEGIPLGKERGDGGDC